MASRFLRSFLSCGKAGFLCSQRRHVVRKWYYTKPEKSRISPRAWAVGGGVLAGLTGCAVMYLGMPEETIGGLDQKPDKYANENVVKAYILRAYDQLKDFRKSFSEPSSDKLLPDSLPQPYQKRYTLVLELKDLIVHTKHDRTNGWTHQKRPGVDALLVRLFHFYEIVIFTDELGTTADSVLKALDPNEIVTYTLFRDSTKYEDGIYVKDLSGLNRPLNRVIVVDVNKDAVKYQPENAIVLERWTGDIHDRTLWDLIPFLQTIAVNEVDDVRPVLDYYKQHGEDNILETYKTIQAKVQEEESLKRNRTSRMSFGGKGSSFHTTKSS